MCADHGQVSAYGQDVDGDDFVGGALAVRDVSDWRGECANQPGVSALVSADCEGVGFSVVRSGVQAFEVAPPHDDTPDIGSWYVFVLVRLRDEDFVFEGCVCLSTIFDVVFVFVVWLCS